MTEPNRTRMAFYSTGDIPRDSRGFRVIFDRMSRYCLAEIAVPSLLAMLVIGFVGVANELRERRANLQLEFIDGWDMARLILYFSPTMIAYLIPIAFMMGILLAFGRLAQNNEITAMKAAGIPLKRLVAPVVVVGALLSIGTFYLQDRVQPRAIARANQLLYVELPQRVTLDMLPAGVMNPIGDIHVYFKSRDPQQKLLRDIAVIVPQSGRNTICYAETARFEGEEAEARLVLSNCQIVCPQPGDNVTTQMTAEYSIPLSSPILRPPPATHKAMTIPELLEREKASAARYASRRSRQNAEDIRSIRTEISERVTLPLACLAVGLAAAPLAVRAPRSGRSYSFTIGIVLLGGYYLLRLALAAKSVHPLEDYVFRGLTPNIALAAIGLWALWRVDRV